MKCLAVCLAIVGLGCSSGSSSSGRCAPEGLWSVKYALDPTGAGSCKFGPPAAESITVQPAVLLFSGSGGSCPADLTSACTVTTDCGGGDGKGDTVTRQDAWHFAGDAFSGSVVFAFKFADGSSCTQNVTVSGTRK